MRFPIHVPDTADDGRRPARSRLAAFGVATLLTASAALAVPVTASADEGAADDAAATVVEESAATAEQPAVPAEEPVESAEPPAEEPAEPPVEEPAATEPADAAGAEPTEPVEDTDLAEFAEEAAAEYDVETAKGAAEASAMLAPAPAGLGPNLPPVAVDDHYVMVQDTTLVVDDPGIRLNDHDPENQWYTVDSMLPELPTEMNYSYDGSFTYTPPAGFVGTRVFTYELEDAESLLSAPATITIEVLPAGASADVPPIANDDLYLWAWNTPLYIPAPGVLANDADADGDPSDLTVSLVTGPYEGSVALNADGSFLFTPLIDESNGSYWFDYRACDAMICADGRVQLEKVESGGVPSGPSQPPAEGQPTVDLPPVAQPDALDAVGGELATFAAPGVLGNDSDPEGQALALVGVSQPSHGTIYSWNGDGTVQYEPNDGFAGTDQVTYTVSDGTLTATSTITFTVTEPANYAPQPLEDEVTMLAGTTLFVDAPGVLGNDSDQDGDPLTVTWAGDAQHGTAAIAGDGSFTYTPDTGFTGTDYVGYEVGDGTETDSTTLIIHVLPADSPAQPSVVGDHYTAMSGALLDVPAPGVLGNDLAPSGPVEVIAVESAQHGTIDVDADGSLRYTSDAGYTGADAVRYTISDGEEQADGLISITVLAAQEDCPADEGLAGTRLGALPAIAVPWEPVPGEPCEADSEPSEVPGEEPGEEPADSTSTPAEPADDGPAAPPADQPARTETASTDAPALASTGIELGLAAAVAALLVALGITLRLRRRAAGH
jgi:hypothetical protein